MIRLSLRSRISQRPRRAKTAKAEILQKEQLCALPFASPKNRSAPPAPDRVLLPFFPRFGKESTQPYKTKPCIKFRSAFFQKINIHVQSTWYFIFGHSPKRYWLRTSAPENWPASHALFTCHP